MKSVVFVFSLLALTALIIHTEGKCCEPCSCSIPLAIPPILDSDGCLHCACPRKPLHPRPNDVEPDCPECECENPIAPPSIDENGCLRCSCPDGPLPPPPEGNRETNRLTIIEKICCAPCICNKSPTTPPSIDRHGCISCQCYPEPPALPVGAPGVPPPHCSPCGCKKPLAPPSIDRFGCLRCWCPSDGPLPPRMPASGPARHNNCPFNQIKTSCTSTCLPKCSHYVRGIDTIQMPCNKMCGFCKCEDGLMLDSNDHCVMAERCGCYSDDLNKYFMVGEKFRSDGEHCECVDLKSFVCQASDGSGSGSSSFDPFIN